MEPRKMGHMNLFAKQKWRQQTEKKCMDTKGGKGGGMNWEIGIDMYILLCMFFPVVMYGCESWTMKKAEP